MRRAALLLCAAGFCACGGPALPPKCQDFGGGTGGGFATESILLTGVRADVTVAVPMTSSCPISATRVETEVLGPDNLPVAHSHGTATSTPNDHRIEVTFTPMLPGSYHVSAKFQPNLGVGQTDVRVALDRTQERDELNIAGPLASGCSHFGVTSLNTVVCEASNSVLVIREGSLVQTLVGPVFSVVGDTVWVVNVREVTRWQDLGTGQLQSLTPKLFLPDSVSALQAGTDEAWVLDSSHVRHFVLESGSFMLRESITTTGYPGFLAVGAAGMVVSTSRGLCSSAGADAGTLRCSDATFDVVAATTDELWIGTSQAEQWLPGRGSSTRTVLAPPNTGFHVAQRQGTTPSTYDGYTIATDGTLAKWSGTIIEAIPGWVVAQYSDGRVGFRRVR